MADAPIPELYRPSCGTEGADFIHDWCDRCSRDKPMRDGTGDGCTILADTFIYGVTDPEYPRQWIYGPHGPCCTAFDGDRQDPDAVVRPLL